jgi:hypothetical protein
MNIAIPFLKKNTKKKEQNLHIISFQKEGLILTTTRESRTKNS